MYLPLMVGRKLEVSFCRHKRIQLSLSCGCFPFQPFQFYNRCTIGCINCTRDQHVFWQDTIKLSKDHNVHLITLPGSIASLRIKQTHDDDDDDDDDVKNRCITFQWIDPSSRQEYVGENITQAEFRDYTNYIKFSYTEKVSYGTFYFVEYVDVEQSKINFQMRLTAERLFTIYGPLHKLTKDYFNCPDENQTSKTFSWYEAFFLCRSINATLPEFHSRKEQEEFIAVLKSGNVFPVEAVFIGLFKGTQVV